MEDTAVTGCRGGTTHGFETCQSTPVGTLRVPAGRVGW